MRKEIERLMETLRALKEFKKVEFVILYGSRVLGVSRKGSDIDVCIYFNARNKREMEKFRLKLLSKLPSNFDVQIFQLLPLYVKKEVLKGKVVHAKNLDFVYQKAFETIKDFESFKRHFYDYIGMRK